MSDPEKIAAVYSYLTEEFEPCRISDSFDPSSDAQLFQIETEKQRCTALVSKDFLKNKSAQAIPGVLRSFLLAEHLKECDFPILVTDSGLSD